MIGWSFSELQNFPETELCGLKGIKPADGAENNPWLSHCLQRIHLLLSLVESSLLVILDLFCSVRVESDQFCCVDDVLRPIGQI